MSKTKTQLQRAIIEISERQEKQDKQQVPDIDFTQHTLEDGTSVSTQERVIKEVCFYIHYHICTRKD